MKRRKNCGECANKARCDQIVARKYAALGIKEPETFKNRACKLFTKKGATT